jgi:hypothetical protein
MQLPGQDRLQFVMLAPILHCNTISCLNLVGCWSPADGPARPSPSTAPTAPPSSARSCKPPASTPPKPTGSPPTCSMKTANPVLSGTTHPPPEPTTPKYSWRQSWNAAAGALNTRRPNKQPLNATDHLWTTVRQPRHRPPTGSASIPQRQEPDDNQPCASPRSESAKPQPGHHPTTPHHRRTVRRTRCSTIHLLRLAC